MQEYSNIVRADKRGGRMAECVTFPIRYMAFLQRIV